MRQSCSLAGTWQFQLDPNGIATIESLNPNREIQVPLPWQAAFPELSKYSGYAWYRRQFDLTESWLDGELLLHFGAVDYWCELYINGQYVGQHEGGYTSFTFPIGSFVQSGHNEVALKVYDSTQQHILISRWPEYSANATSAHPPFDANNIPHGKQEWYINAGGIWQDVTLTTVPTIYLDYFTITTNIHTGEVLFKIELAWNKINSSDGALLITVQAEDSVSWEVSVPLSPEKICYEATVKVENFRLWDVDSPTLYTATLKLFSAGGEDTIEGRFGFREISTRDGQLLLNGEPIFLLSVLDQDLYADTIYTVPSEEYLRDQFQKAKELGFNNLRCHIKPPDPLYFDLADEMGLLVWAEIPSWRTFYPKGTVHPNQLNLDENIHQRVERTLEEMIRRDYNHPSIIIWTIVNEDWGTALPLSANDRAWVSQMYERCKQLDPTRLVVDNSACLHAWGPNVHVQSDLDDFHIYANIPDQAEKFEQTIEQFNLRPLWTYSSHSDSQRTGREPLILSEFGNWGLPSLEALRRHYKGDPDWFELGPWWSPWEGEPGWAKGVEERFYRLGLAAIWGDYERFVTATQWHQFAALKFEIETLRRQPALAGYVVTELADIYWESNGLLDFLRNPKVYHNQFGSINAPDMLIPQLAHNAFWDDQLLRLRLHAAHYSSANWAGAKVEWSLGNSILSSEELTEPVKRGEVKVIGLRHWNLPTVEATQSITFEGRLYSKAADELAQNQLEVIVLPAKEREARYRQPIAVITRHSEVLVSDSGTDFSSSSGETLSNAETVQSGLGQLPLNDSDNTNNSNPLGVIRALQQLGYDATSQLNSQTRLAITNYPTDELLKWVREGGDLLFISNGPSPFYWVQSRGGAYSGNWISSFSWLRPGVHRRLDGLSNPLQLPFRHVMPIGTILGLPVRDPTVQADFLAGMVSGWVQHPAVHTVQFRFGRGRVIMTTFELLKALREYHDPVAIAMLHDLTEYLTSDKCQPVLEANY